ncbi:MAG: AarF/ABC1/UbiB kinase family protein [Actinobacteria bacterium]|nr:MAG: AarF/ABC1/UbiB kinase family protein [Actinomycetota bacterium]
MSLKRSARNTKRIAEIVQTAARHGFSYFIQYIGLTNLLSKKKVEPLATEEVMAKQLRHMLEELGPTFIKMGQLISIRPDLVPPEFIFELEKLQDTVAPMSYTTVKARIEEELRRPMGEIFSSFDKKALASASIGQVHKAILKEGGQTVAVKVMRTNIRSQIDADIDIVRYIASLAQKKVDFIDLQAVVNEFAASLHRELDYTVEGRHVDRFRFNFKDDSLIKIPLVFWKYSSKRVLVLEFIDGWKLSDLAQPESLGVDTYELAKHGAEAFMKQVLEDGFFHGDLHPANLLITPDAKIAYLDFGIVGSISETDKETLAKLLMAIIRKDTERVLAEVKKLGVEITPDRVEAIKPGISEIVNRYYGRSLGDVKIDIIGKEFLMLVYQNKIRIPKNYALLVKALITIEGVAKKIYPDINILDIAKPYVVKLIAEKYPSGFVTQGIKEELKSLMLLATQLPKQLNDVLGLAKRGHLELKYRHTGLEPLLHKLDSVVNRLSISLVLASIILASSVLALYRTTRILGAGFFLAATILALWLVFSMWKNRG